MIRLQNVTRSYVSDGTEIRALDSISFEIPDHAFVTITGPSGCGKSTLLNVLGGLDKADSGEIHVDDFPLHTAGETELTQFRRHRLGMVFQFFNLLPSMTLIENVELPLVLQGIPRREIRSRGAEMVELVGLSARSDHFPSQLSGGEMQRAAIARALIHRPSLLLADEPTGNLDSGNAERVLSVLTTIASQRLTTMLLVTHSPEVACLAPRQISMLDGKILND